MECLVYDLLLRVATPPFSGALFDRRPGKLCDSTTLT